MKLSDSRKSGFTLIEMLLVVTVMVILLGLLVPTLIGPRGAATMTTTAQAMAGELKMGRQEAITKNRIVEVRFLSGDGAIRGYQMLRREEDGTLRPVEEFQRLPDGLVISENSTLTQLGPAQPALPAEVPTSFPTPATIRSFLFQVDGSTDLGLSDQWFFTLVDEQDTGTPPANFATIQIEPLTGAIRVHRPN